MTTAAPSDDFDRTILRLSGLEAGAALLHVGALPGGTRLNEFEILEPSSEDGGGVVYRAFDHTLNRAVALKEYLPSALATRVERGTVAVRAPAFAADFSKGLASFVNEARLLAQFNHPSLVNVYRVWEANGTAYVVTPSYEGDTLTARLAMLGAPPDERWLLELLDPLLDALAMLHAVECVHRDISPDNILILANGWPLLLEFGVAQLVPEDSPQALTVILKPGYAPIEQYAESRSIPQGPWTDLYALGAMVRFAITGERPTASMARLVSDSLVPLEQMGAGRYDAAFLRAIDRSMAVRPKDRPQDVGELRAMLGLDPVAAAVVPMREAERPPADARPGLATLAAIRGILNRARSAIVIAAVAAGMVGLALSYVLNHPAELPAFATPAPSAPVEGAGRPPRSAPGETVSSTRPAEPAPAPGTTLPPPAAIATPPAASNIVPSVETSRSPSRPAAESVPADIERGTARVRPTKEDRDVTGILGNPASDRTLPRFWPEQCTDIVQRASLGERLTAEEQALLGRDCK